MPPRDFKTPAPTMSWRRRAALAFAGAFVAVVVWRFSAVMLRRAAVRALEESGWTVVLEDPPAGSSTILDRITGYLGQSGTFIAGMLGREPEVVEVRIADMEAPAAGNAELNVLQRLPQLQRLSVQRADLSSSDVASIGRIPSLTELFIASNSLTDESLDKLSALSRLESLTVISQRVTDEGLAHLGPIATMRSLDLQSTRAGGGTVDAFPHLESLALGPATRNEDLEAVSRLTGLEVLILTDSRISDDGLRRLRTLQSLESLHLSGPHSVTDNGLNVLGELGQLKQLTLHGQHYTWAGLTLLGKSSHLEQIELRGGGLDDAGFDSFVPPRSLKVLRLHNTSISDEGFDRFETRYPKIELWR